MELPEDLEKLIFSYLNIEFKHGRCRGTTCKNKVCKKKRRDGLFCAHHKKILKSKKNNRQPLQIIAEKSIMMNRVLMLSEYDFYPFIKKNPKPRWDPMENPTAYGHVTGNSPAYNKILFPEEVAPYFDE